MLFRSKSILYKTILNAKNLRPNKKLEALTWPEQVRDFSSEVCFTCSVKPSDSYLEQLEEVFKKIIRSGKTASFEEGFEFNGDGFNFNWGFTYLIDIQKIREDTMKFVELQKFIEDSSFPLMEEYSNVKKYRTSLKARVQKKERAKKLSRK